MVTGFIPAPTAEEDASDVEKQDRSHEASSFVTMARVIDPRRYFFALDRYIGMPPSVTGDSVTSLYLLENAGKVVLMNEHPTKEDLKMQGVTTDMHGQDGDDLVTQFVEFQRTGKGFGDLWPGLEPLVKDFARRKLRALGVWVRAGDGAVGDVTGQTVERLLRLSAEGARGRFDPLKASKPGLSGFRGWLYRVVANQAATWARNERGGRRVRIIPESALGTAGEWNDLPGDDDRASILKNAVAKVHVDDSELVGIMNECLAELPQERYRTVLRLHNWEGLPERAIARQLGTSVSDVHRTLVKARTLLEGSLRRRGIDESWFGGAA